MLILGIELRSSDLIAIPFAHWLISLAHVVVTHFYFSQYYLIPRVCLYAKEVFLCAIWFLGYKSVLKTLLECGLAQCSLPSSCLFKEWKKKLNKENQVALFLELAYFFNRVILHMLLHVLHLCMCLEVF